MNIDDETPTTELQIKCVKAKISDVAKDDITGMGVYKAYASVFNNVDSYGDVVMPGAFSRTLKAKKGMIPIVWMHDPMQPLGMATAEEDEHGLKITGELNLDVALAREVYSLMKQGVVGDHSFAYDVVKSKPDKRNEKDVRLLNELKLFEVSPLTNGFAANPEAGLLMVKRRFDTSQWGASFGKQKPDPAKSHSVGDPLDEHSLAAKADMAMIASIKASIQDFNNHFKARR